MGKTDQRLQKLQTLPAASRSIILDRTQKLRDASCDKSYRSYRKQVELKRELEINWNKNMNKFRDDAEKKKEVLLKIAQGNLRGDLLIKRSCSFIKYLHFR